MNGRDASRLGLLALIWGASFLFIKLALEGLSPIQIVLGRLAAGAAVLLAICAVQRRALPKDPTVWGHLALLGIGANIIPFFLFGWGEERVTSALAGLLNGATPLFTVVFAVALLPEERATPGRWAGLILGFFGVLVVVGPAALGVGAQASTATLAGLLACVGAAACYGVTIVYTRRYVANRGYSALVLSASQLLVATLILALAAPFVARDPMTLTGSVVASIVILGALGTGVAYVLYYGLIARVGATMTSTVTYLIPVVAVALGVLVLGEPVTWNVFAGGAIVILGVAQAEGRLDRISPLPAKRIAPIAPAE